MELPQLGTNREKSHRWPPAANLEKGAVRLSGSLFLIRPVFQEVLILGEVSTNMISKDLMRYTVVLGNLM